MRCPHAAPQRAGIFVSAPAKGVYLERTTKGGVTTTVKRLK